MKVVMGAFIVLVALGAVADASARQLHGVLKPSNKPSKPSKPAMKPAMKPTASSSTTNSIAAVGGSSGSKPSGSKPMTPAPTELALAQESVTSLASVLKFTTASSPPPAFPRFVAIPIKRTAAVASPPPSNGMPPPADTSEPPPPSMGL